MRFVHGQGDDTTATRVSIYGLSGLENGTLSNIADACYSNGGRFLGTLGAEDEITGLNITEYKHTVTNEETSFNFTFGRDIKENAFTYNETEVDDTGTKVATIQFCVMMELLRQESPDPTAELVVVNYAEFAFDYDATLNGTIVLADAFQVKPADPAAGGLEDDTFVVIATVCGPDGLLAGDTINQGDSVHICINSTSYPEASISGIDTMSYSAAISGGGNVVLDAIVEGTSKDILTRFVALEDCDGSQCIVKTQLQANFFPPDGFMNVSISGKATLELGGRRILAEVAPGDRSLQETSQSSFSLDVETAASDTSAGTMKKGVATSIIVTIFAAGSVRFF